MRVLFVASLLFFLCFAGSLSAAPADQVPDSLKPWIPWVKAKHPQIDCPRQFDNSDFVSCSFPASLSLKVDKKSAGFTQSWEIYADSWAVLPGDAESWPTGVKEGGKEMPVVAQNGVPSVFLSKGRHELTGRINWETRPNALKISADTGLLSLVIDGRAVNRLNIDGEGRLWFGDAASDEPEKKIEDSATVKVFRKVSDGVPVIIESRVLISVSGRDRELMLGRFLPDKSVPLSLESQLPARIEAADGNLRVQVRAGKWTVTLLSRQTEPVKALEMKKLTDDWPAQEVWLFQADNTLRDVKIQGAATMDVSQIEAPNEWKSFPAYLMTAESKFELIEEHRGESASVPNKLSINRQFWLDFKGSGLTTLDQITGELTHDKRLSMTDGFQLGRIEQSGAPRLITSIDGSQQGIELRQGSVALEAAGTYTRSGFTIPAIGWSEDMNSANIRINLPPGFSLFHVLGADSVSDSWVEKWNVWDLFMIFIIVILVMRFVGLPWALITLAALAISYHEANAPVFSWLNIIAALIFYRLVPEEKFSRFKRFLRYYLIFSFGIIFIIAIPFAVGQVRKGIYPQLEYQRAINDWYNSRSMVSSGSARRGLDEKEESAPMAEQKIMLRKSLGDEGRIGTRGKGGMDKKEDKAQDQTLQQETYSAAEKVQTGPGVPTWNWNAVNISWNGPVKKDHTIQVITISPLINTILALLRVILIFLILFKLISATRGRPLSLSRITHLFSPAILPLLILGIFAAPALLRAETPSDTILKELEDRITKIPECFPSCASVIDGGVEINAETLTIRLTIDAAATVTVPLPGSRASWFPTNVKVDGAAARSLYYNADESLYCALSAGRHQITLSGPVAGSSFQLTFPLEAHNIIATAQGWSHSGLVGGRLPEKTLQFDRIAVSKEKKQAGETLLPDPIEPFYEVQRTIILDNDWRVETEIRRIAPENGAIVAEIALLDDESVTTRDVVVKERIVKAVLGTAQPVFTWQSDLKIKDKITLAAPRHMKWREVWRIRAASKWHIEESGFPRMRQDTSTVNLVPMWIPLPGETMSFAITKPQAMQGSTRTIENMIIETAPGKSAANNKLAFTIRSSIGDKLSVTLPDQSKVRSILADGAPQTITNEKNTVSIPLHPGVQSINVEWEGAEGIALLTKTPAVSVESSLTNIDLKMKLPYDRWVIFVGGPAIGPAMLIWGIIIVLLIIAFVLGKFENLPIRTWQWMLLFIGMSTIHNIGGLFVVIWFFALAKRGTIKEGPSMKNFNNMQFLLVLLTIAAIGSILASIPMSLLSSPDMQITGNGSSSWQLNWYQDHAANALPQGWVVSLPLWIYRASMLLWALWLAFMLPKWLKWGWVSFSNNGIWYKPAPAVKPEVKPAEKTEEKEEIKEQQ